MTKVHSRLEPSQVLDALRDEAREPLGSPQRARLLSRIDASVVALSAAGTLAQAGGNDYPLNSGTEASISVADRLSAHLAAHPVTTTLSMLALGGALGAGTYASVTPRHHHATQTPAVVGQSAPAPAALAFTPEPSPIVSIADLPQEATAVPAATGSALAHRRTNAAAGKPWAETAAPPGMLAPTPSLAEQLALLEAARNAIRQHDAKAAQRALDAHATQFPNSALAEEREALTIRALTMAHRLLEAKSRLARFETAFPGSLLLPSLRRTLGNNP